MRAIATANKDRESSQPVANSGSRDSDAVLVNQSSQQRSLSGSKYNQSYAAQQLKKQVQMSSQANNIDPLATKQYLQNYLSEHTTNNKAQGTPVKVPIKAIKKAQQTLAQSIRPQGAPYSKNYGSNNGAQKGLGELQGEESGNNQRANGSNPPSRNHHNRNERNAVTSTSALNTASEPLTSMSGEASQTFDRRKDRVLSSQKQKFAQTSTTNDNILGNSAIGATVSQGQASRSLVRPSSKIRNSSHQPGTMIPNKINSNAPSASAALIQPVQKTSSSQPRGQSPKISQPTSTTNTKQSVPTQLNMSNQNLQSYFENQPQQFQAGSSKNLPRKKRINVQQQQQHQQQQSNLLGPQKSDSGIFQRQQHQHRGTTVTTSGFSNTANTGSSSQAPPRAPSPASASFGDRTSSQQQQQDIVKRPASRNTSNNNRPQGADHGPQPFEKEELFLNVDSQYNELILQMIQPNRSHFDFEGSVQYVMNASELSNQALARLIYSRKHVPLPKVPEKLQLKGTSGRSRNQAGGLSTLGNNGGAGQSTSSFFNTKKSFSAATFQLASSGLIDNAIRRAEGYHDGPDPNAIIGKDFHPMIRNEIRSASHEAIKQLMPDYQPAKYSAKRNGIVAAYGANTNQGIVRTYNEDRVAIILNIMKPKSKQFTGSEWPKCSFFGIYDGHGGHVCADFLRDYLHQFIIKDQFFPNEPIKAIKNGFREAEKLFLEFAEGQQNEIGDIDRSGSCAIVALIIDDMCYIGNTGDSRACMSADGGRQVVSLSTDHKPTEEVEMHRILTKGGRIYQNASIVNVQQANGGLQSQIVLGPHRVFPGRLSVCRTFGDIEAKLERLEGNDRVVVADPDVTAFRIDREKHDFIVIGCDGIFDKLENRDCVHLVWQACLMEQLGNDPLVNSNDEEQTGGQKQGKTHDERRHKLVGLAVDSILKACAMRRSCDNITSVVIGFDNFYRKFDQVKRGARSQQVSTSNDHEVIEEIQMKPVNNLDMDKSIIYIESDDHQESISESQSLEPSEFEPPKKISEVSATGRPIEVRNSNQGLPLYGETGTTQLAGISEQQAAAMGMMHIHQSQQMAHSAHIASMIQSSTDLNNKTDKILSEIAEEDSISMISDRPRRLKPSEAFTPVDPVTNSFMMSQLQRDSQIMFANQSRDNHNQDNLGGSAANQLLGTSQMTASSLTANNRKASKTNQQGNPYLGGEEPKNALVGTGVALITQKSQSSMTNSYMNKSVNASSQNENNNSDLKTSGSDSLNQKNNRPSSSTKQKRSSSGQGQRVQMNQGSSLHSLIEQNSGQMRSRQPKNNLAHDKGISQTMPALNARDSGATSSAYGNIIGSYTNVTAVTTSAQNSSNTANVSSSKTHSQSTLAQISAQQIHSQQQLIHNQVLAGSHQNNNSQSQQFMPLLGDSSTSNSQANSTSALYQVTQSKSSQARRSSNQSHQRNQYGNQNKTQTSITQSQGSMPPSSTSTPLLPIQPSAHGSGNIQLSSQKVSNGQRSSQQKNKSADTGKNKAKTQQPNKLSEIFRQVDNKGQVINQTSMTNNTGNNSGQTSGNASTQFVPKGSLSSSNNQMLVRTMQINNQNIVNGAQVHNIQIKPISANKRRAAGTQNIIQNSFLSSGTAAQQNQGANNVSSNQISEIMSGRPLKDKAQFSQTSIIKQQTAGNQQEFANSTTVIQSKPSQNKLISQYLAEVNQSSQQQVQQTQYINQNSAVQQSSYTAGGGAYASRSTRKSDKSPGVLSRANRVQMTYNQSLPQSKTIVQNQMQQQQPMSAQGSRNPSSNSSHQHHPNQQPKLGSSTSAVISNNAYSQLPPSGHGVLQQKKGADRSRNSINSSSSNNVSAHQLPKWQSLNSTGVGSSVHGNGAPQHSQTHQNLPVASSEMNNLSYGGVKKY